MPSELVLSRTMTSPPVWNEALPETFRERLMARDKVEFLMAVPLTIWVLTLFQVVPTVIAYWCLLHGGVRGGLEVLALPLGFAALVDVGLLGTLPAFRNVTVDGDGLLFQRYAGPSKRVTAESLISVARAPRLEVFRRVWLWPGIPLRGSLVCGSTRDQFHIRWKGGEYYFAPSDPHGFVEALRRRRSDLVVDDDHAARSD